MTLSFLTPLMLAGAALIAVPIVLHLIMRRQPKHVVFPAMRFIQRREEANRRQLRLRHLLLLLLRCMAIVLLALALARPTVKSAGFGVDQEAPVAAALVFDTSPRMNYQHENKTRLAAAQETALWLLPQLPPESEVAVVESGAIAPTFAVDPTAARKRIERLTTTAGAQAWLDLVESALQLVNDSTKERKEVYLFTDLAQTAWPAESANRLKLKLDEYDEVALYVIDVGVEDPRNFALGDVKLSSETIAKNSPVRLEANLNRRGPNDERSVALYVADEAGQLQKRDEKSFTWLSDQAQSAEFTLPGLPEGTHQGMLSIIGDDALDADNVRYFTVDVRPPWRVLIAAPEPIEIRAGFLRDAIAPPLWRTTGQARFDVTVIGFDKLLEAELQEYAAVCLLDPPPLEPAVWETLQKYVEHGLGLTIWLGRNAADLERFNQPAAQQVLPGKLLRQARWSGELFLSPPDLEHPTLRGFRSRGSQVPWAAFPVEKYWQFDELDDGVNIIVPYSNGKPALVEQAIGKGRVLTTTTPISDPASDPEWNMLVAGFENWPIMVLSTEMMLYAVGSTESRFNYSAGDTAVVHVDEKQRLMVFTLRTPQDLNIPLTVDQKQGTITVSTTTAVGNYELRAGASVGGISKGFSVNLPAAATALDRVEPAQLDTMLGEERYRLARNRDEITRDVSLGRVGVELYPGLILAVALILGLEHVLANRFYRRDTSVAMEPQRPASLVQEPPAQQTPGRRMAATT